MLAAAVWNNVALPVDVNGDDLVVPFDALLVINELNNPQFSEPQTRALPKQIADDAKVPFLDVTCDGLVTTLDALLVINYLNSDNPSQDAEFNSGTGTFATAACSPQLLEESDFASSFTRIITLPDNTSAVEVRFQAPEFDKAARRMVRDAFEIEVSDLEGNSVALPYAPNRDAVFNWSEDLEPVYGPASKQRPRLRARIRRPRSTWLG